MAKAANLTEVLLNQINRGEAAGALPRIRELLQRHRGHAGLLTLQAEALRSLARTEEAIDAYRQAAKAGGGARNWLVAGMLLAGQQRIDDALACLNQGLAAEPENQEILNALVTTLFNANRHREGMTFARRLLALSRNEQYLSNAALLLQSNQQYEEATGVFRKILGEQGDKPAVLGAALVPARFTCEWEWIESLQRRIGAYYARGEFASTQEYPLTHLTWCNDEHYNLEVTRAYAGRMVPAVAPLATAARKARPGHRIRVGYLSCDFCNHATMHLMAGLLECHDRSRVEIFAYDYSRPDTSSYRQRFLNAVEHHVDVTALTNADAAARIAADQLDILFDLKGHTGWGRLGIMAYRPAPLQAAYLGFPGSTGTDFIDYIVGDRYVTPDSSAPYYTEKFCRLPHSYQCNDRKRPVAGEAGSRADHGLPDHAVVFSAFNQSYKIDRGSFNVWMRVLLEVPGSVLWVLGQGEAAERNLRRYAQQAGVAPDRLVFSGFASPEQHLARLQLADASLDTLICNGHTTTSDTLWAGVPVVTMRGSHFCSRVSESLLRAIDLPELVAADEDGMVRIAARIGRDGGYRRQLRDQVKANRTSSPLFDTEAFTRDFERAIVMMVEASRAGGPLLPIDVPDSGTEVAARPAKVAATPGSEVASIPRQEENALKINLGCGSDYLVGWLNVDRRAEVNPDRIIDLEQIPWPLEDDCADEILLKHVLERLGQGSEAFLAVIGELYRIGRPGATIRIQVRHPRNNDFLSDPTQVRPILPELFAAFDLATVEMWQENRLPGTPLAKQLKVDFEPVDVKHHLTAHWQKELAEGRVDAAGILHAIRSYNNVVDWIDIVLRVRKPFRPGHALRKVDAICLERHGGMGDVLMALTAAKALKTYSDRPIVLATAPALRSVAAACPHIDQIVGDEAAARKQYPNLKYMNLSPVAFGMSRLHQADAYLQAFGVSADAGLKRLDLQLDLSAEAEAGSLVASWPTVARGRARVLLHVGPGDPNRSWPGERWAELASTLIGLGHQVVMIGSSPKGQGLPFEPGVRGLLSAFNQLSALGTVALMRRSDLLVSTDAGPVQLAAASDIAIVGLYSVVAGGCRLPFRHGMAGWRAVEVKPSCRFHPCYQQMNVPGVMAPYATRLQQQTLSPAELFATWCPDGGSYACMRQQITVPMVLEAIGRLDATWVAGKRKPVKGGGPKTAAKSAAKRAGARKATAAARPSKSAGGKRPAAPMSRKPKVRK